MFGLQEISLIAGILISWIGTITVAIRVNSDRKDLENRVNINDARIDSNKMLIITIKDENKQALDLLGKNQRETQEALLHEIKESNKLLNDLNNHIIRFEERQETQWRTLQKHTEEIEILKKNLK